eukprot:COSAG02_NODE_398_length_23118_cov_49.968939_10_plen_196_part_00
MLQGTPLLTGHRSKLLFCLSVGSRPIYHQKAEILNVLMVYRSAKRRQIAGELQAHKGQYSDKQQRQTMLQGTPLLTGHRSELLFCLYVGSRPIYHQKAEILNVLMVYRSAMCRQIAGELQAHKGQYSDKQQRQTMLGQGTASYVVFAFRVTLRFTNSLAAPPMATLAGELMGCVQPTRELAGRRAGLDLFQVSAT